MSIVVTKSGSVSGYYSADNIADGVSLEGTMSLYSIYPGGVIKLTRQLDYDIATKRLALDIPNEEIRALDSGVYYMVATITSAAFTSPITNVDFLTVLPITAVPAQPMTTLNMTIVKVDGTPAGKEIRTFTNTVDGAIVALGWAGVQVTASHPVADEISGAIIGTETISTETNPAGYAQLSVIKGQTVTVSCPSFGKSVTVDTTGHDSIDLSSYF